MIRLSGWENPQGKRVPWSRTSTDNSSLRDCNRDGSFPSVPMTKMEQKQRCRLQNLHGSSYVQVVPEILISQFRAKPIGSATKQAHHF